MAEHTTPWPPHLEEVHMREATLSHDVTECGGADLKLHTLTQHVLYSCPCGSFVKPPIARRAPQPPASCQLGA